MHRHRIFCGAATGCVRLVATMLLAAAVVSGSPARATVTTYTDSANFQAAIAGFSHIDTLDFDAEAPGTTIPSGGAVGGVTFTQAIGFDLLIDNFFDTTSGANYLGVNDFGQFQFVGGDAFTMDFGSTMQAVGLFVIGGPGQLFPDDITLAAGAGSVSNAAAPEAIFPDPDFGEVFFVGLVDTDGFQTATLSSFAANYVFTVDDITFAVAEPGTLALFAIGLMGLALARRRREEV